MMTPLFSGFLSYLYLTLKNCICLSLALCSDDGINAQGRKNIKLTYRAIELFNISQMYKSDVPPGLHPPCAQWLNASPLRSKVCRQNFNADCVILVEMVIRAMLSPILPDTHGVTHLFIA